MVTELLPPQDDLWEEMFQLLEAYSEHLEYISQVFSHSKSRGISEEELISGTITGKWADHRKRRETVIAMNIQVSIIIFIYNSTFFNFNSSDP